MDVDFAKCQVELLLRTAYVHPNGQIPAYEWNFSDVNPPVSAWALLYVYEREAEIRGRGATMSSSPACSTVCSPTSPGGSIARIPTTAICSKAASSAWTTSESSIARRRYPAGGTLERNVARAFRNAKRPGEIPKHINPAVNATDLMATGMGLMAVGKTNPGREVLETIVNTPFAELVRSTPAHRGDRRVAFRRRSF